VDRLKRLLAFSSAAIVSSTFTYAQGLGSSFVNNLQSGAILESVNSIVGTSFFLWAAIFLILARSVQYGAKKVWPDMKAPSRNSIAISMAFVLTYSLSKTGIADQIPNYKVVALVALTAVIALSLNSIKDAQGKPRFGIIPSIIIALLVGGALIYGSSLISGQIPSILGTKEADLSTRIISGGTPAPGSSSNPNVNWQLGQDALKRYDYAAAREYFSLVIAAGPGPNNPHYNEAGDYIGPEKDLLYGRMVQQYEKVIDYETAAIINLLSAAKESPNADEQKMLKNEAATLIAKTKEQIKEVCRESAKRGRPCKTQIS